MENGICMSRSISFGKCSLLLDLHRDVDFNCGSYGSYRFSAPKLSPHKHIYIKCTKTDLYPNIYLYLSLLSLLRSYIKFHFFILVNFLNYSYYLLSLVYHSDIFHQSFRLNIPKDLHLRSLSMFIITP